MDLTSLNIQINIKIKERNALGWWKYLPELWDQASSH
jgi:hypothetical protein